MALTKEDKEALRMQLTYLKGLKHEMTEEKIEECDELISEIRSKLKLINEEAGYIAITELYLELTIG